jgi:thiol-disulfide isomerase/thioredoxin
MSPAVRNSILFVVVVAVVGSIYYLESQKVSLPSSASAANDTIDLSTIFATSTASTATSTAPSGTPGTSAAATTAPVHTADFAQLAAKYPAAKELVSVDGYINTGTGADGSANPITIKSLIGHKVVLLDFWTYSCINCQRTLPYLEAWNAKYKDAGLEIIGVQSPEFNFEKVLSNVQAAVTKFGITYPVVLDNEMGTWNAYGNEYWPEDYLIDINGLVVDRNIGEGNYAAVEQEIQKLLLQRATALGLPASTVPTGIVNVSNVAINTNSPESYFGSARNEYLANGTQATAGTQTLTVPAASSMQMNQLYLGGTWNFQDQYAQTTDTNETIYYPYSAQHVYFVASAAQAGQNISITVMRDGVPLTTDRGADVDSSGNATINQSRLYDLVDQPASANHTLEIIVHNAGLQAYTFTFG